MSDFLLWIYYTMSGINKIVNKKYFCARLKTIIYLLSVYILYRLLILHAPPLPPLRGGGVSEADERGLPRSLLPASLASCLLPARRRCPGSQTGADEVPRARTRAIYYIVGSAAHRSAKPSHNSLVAFPLIFCPCRPQGGRTASQISCCFSRYSLTPCRPQGGRTASQISCCFPRLVLCFLPYRSVNFLENEKKTQPGRASGTMRRPVGGIP